MCHEHQGEKEGKNTHEKNMQSEKAALASGSVQRHRLGQFCPKKPMSAAKTSFKDTTSGEGTTTQICCGYITSPVW